MPLDDLFIQLRKKGFTHASIARKIGASERSVRRWANGWHAPLPSFREHMERLLSEPAR